MVGIAKQKGNKEFSCMHGKKMTKDIISDMVDDRETVTMRETHHSHGWNFAQTASAPEKTPVQLAQAEAKGTMRTLHDVDEATRINFAQLVNEAELPWKAMAYSQVDMERLANNPRNTLAQTGHSRFNPPEDVL